MRATGVIKLIVFVSCILFCHSQFAIAQAPGEANSNSRQINILQSDTLRFKKLNDTTSVQILSGHVVVKQQNNLFYCDSAILNQRTNTLEAFGHVHINNADSVHTYADYLQYIGNDKTAFLRRNVRLTDGKGTLSTPELDYNTQTKIGVYRQGGVLVNGATTLTSRDGFYYGETRDATFKNDVLLVNPDYKVTTDTLLYNTYTNIATFVVPTTITSGKRIINTTSGYYNLATKQAYFGQRPIIQDSTSTLIADETASEDSSGNFEARGNAIYRDTAQGYALFANNIKGNRKSSVVLATEHPVMMVKRNNDSLFIAADTLFTSKLSSLAGIRNVPRVRDSGIASPPSVGTEDTLQNAMPDSLALAQTKQPKDSSTDRYVEAYYHVRIYSDSLQATGDSLFYSAEDSVFRMFKNPVVWANNSQITGDTIYLFTKNKKPERVYVFENALTLSNVDSSGFFNQLKGRTINGYFVNGKIDFIRTKGSAESVYYTQDDDNKFIGVDKSSCDVIETYFKDDKPEKVSRINNLKGTFYPIQQVNHEDLKLRGFNWQMDKRPKSHYELFGS